MTNRSVMQFRADFSRVAAACTGVELVAMFEELGQVLVERAWPGARPAFEAARVVSSWMDTLRARDGIATTRATPRAEATQRVRFPEPPPFPSLPRFWS